LESRHPKAVRSKKKSTQNFPREIFASHAGMIFKAFGEEKER
jgi:hypothetical protein